MFTLFAILMLGAFDCPPPQSGLCECFEQPTGPWQDRAHCMSACDAAFLACYGVSATDGCCAQYRKGPAWGPCLVDCNIQLWECQGGCPMEMVSQEEIDCVLGCEGLTGEELECCVEDCGAWKDDPVMEPFTEVTSCWNPFLGPWDDQQVCETEADISLMGCKWCCRRDKTPGACYVDCIIEWQWLSQFCLDATPVEE